MNLEARAKDLIGLQGRLKACGIYLAPLYIENFDHHSRNLKPGDPYFVPPIGQILHLAVAPNEPINFEDVQELDAFMARVTSGLYSSGKMQRPERISRDYYQPGRARFLESTQGGDARRSIILSIQPDPKLADLYIACVAGMMNRVLPKARNQKELKGLELQEEIEVDGQRYFLACIREGDPFSVDVMERYLRGETMIPSPVLDQKMYRRSYDALV